MSPEKETNKRSTTKGGSSACCDGGYDFHFHFHVFLKHNRAQELPFHPGTAFTGQMHPAIYISRGGFKLKRWQGSEGAKQILGSFPANRIFLFKTVACFKVWLAVEQESKT